jgi:hypothetical protein
LFNSAFLVYRVRADFGSDDLSALQQIHIKIRKRQLAQLTTKIFEFVNRCLTSQQIEHQDYSNGAANGRAPFLFDLNLNFRDSLTIITFFKKSD